METRTLGLSSLRPSVLGLGTLHMGTLCSETESITLIHHALEHGVTFFDTAPMYGEGRAEGLLGKAVKGRRDRVILATKVGLRPAPRPDGTFGVTLEPLTPEAIRARVEASLKAMGTSHIDLLQIHAFDSATPLDATLRALDALQQEGKVRFLGCSNHAPDELKTCLTAQRVLGLPTYVSCQVHYNLLERRAEAELQPLCREAQVSIICNRVLGRGLITGKYLPGQPLPKESRAAMSPRIHALLGPKELALVARLQAFALELERPLPSLAVAWILSRPSVAVALVGVRHIAQLDTCLEGAIRPLGKADLQALDLACQALLLEPPISQRPPAFLET